jgi:hypothetical protein
MAAEDFFNRWSKAKAHPAPEAAPASAAGAADQAANLPQPGQAAEPAVRPLPTIDDVAGLTHDSDYSPFMASGVDEAVKHSAMKKLFSDPHFNVMDGLDIYIGNYNVFEPIPPEMLASLNHAKTLLDPLAQFEKPLMQLLEKANPAEADSNRESSQRTGEAQAAKTGEPESVDPDPAATPEESAPAVMPSSEPLASREAYAAPAAPADRTNPA